MTHVATLVCKSTLSLVDQAAADAVAAALGSAGAVWLAPGVAVDVLFTPQPGVDRASASARARDALKGSAIDVIVQPVAGRRKALFLADMDSTIIGQECIDELADLVGLKPLVSAITERAMRGEIAFEPALRERVALLAGLDANVIDDVIAHRITLNPGARSLVQTMRKHGAYTALVSGGFTVFTSRIAAMVGFNMDRANELIVENGTFAGRVAEPILGREAKRASLLALREERGLPESATLATGDGANDLDMLGVAGLGVAYHAKPAVAAAAHARLDHADLTALLYAQGYAREDFAE